MNKIKKTLINLTFKILILFYFASFLNGCGQTGALYLPSDSDPIKNKKTKN